MTSPLVGYLGRGTGVVLLVLMTLTTVLGVLATGRSLPPVLAAVRHPEPAPGARRDVGAPARRARGLRGRRRVRRHPLVAGTGPLGGHLPTALPLLSGPSRSTSSRSSWSRPPASASVTKGGAGPSTSWCHASWALGVGHGLAIGTDSGVSWFAPADVGCVAAVVVAGLARVVGSGAGSSGAGDDDDRIVSPESSPSSTSAPDRCYLRGSAKVPGWRPMSAVSGDLPARFLAALLGSREEPRPRTGRGRLPFRPKLEAGSARGRRPVVVVNAAEGEPASDKDLVSRPVRRIRSSTAPSSQRGPWPRARCTSSRRRPPRRAAGLEARASASGSDRGHIRLATARCRAALRLRTGPGACSSCSPVGRACP